MQRNEVKAFRQRLIRAGFEDISVYNNCNGTYTVYCTAPDGTKIRLSSVTLEYMNNTPRTVWFPEYGI